MSAGRTAKKQTSREKSQPPSRGQNFVASAKNNPIPAKSSKLDSGAIQMKCRLNEVHSVAWKDLEDDSRPHLQQPTSQATPSRQDEHVERAEPAVGRHRQGRSARASRRIRHTSVTENGTGGRENKGKMFGRARFCASGIRDRLDLA